MSRLCRPASIGLAVIAPSRGIRSVGFFFLDFLFSTTTEAEELLIEEVCHDGPSREIEVPLQGKRRGRRGTAALPPRARARHCCLPRAVVEVRVPRGPGAVEGKGQLLVVLVLLTPHPEGGEHFLRKESHRQPSHTVKSCFTSLLVDRGSNCYMTRRCVSVSYSLPQLLLVRLLSKPSPTPLWNRGHEQQAKLTCSKKFDPPVPTIA